MIPEPTDLQVHFVEDEYDSLIFCSTTKFVVVIKKWMLNLWFAASAGYNNIVIAAVYTNCWAQTAWYRIFTVCLFPGLYYSALLSCQVRGGTIW